MSNYTEFYKKCKKSKYGKILIFAIEQLYESEVIDTDMEYLTIGKDNSYYDKQDWIESKLWELKEEIERVTE